MGGESGVEGGRDCAVEHGRRKPERTEAREYMGGGAEEVGNEVLSAAQAASFLPTRHELTRASS